jgi:high-affinity Fe2+/Pb2+ permease
MATHTESLVPWPVARQLRRMRALYAAGVALWAASSAWTGWVSPGSRPMWTSLLLLAVFTGLLVTASWWLRRPELAER